MELPRLIRVALLRLRSLAGRSRVEQELDEELRDHLEAQMHELTARGMTPQQARTAALRQLGGLEAVKEDCRDRRRVGLVEDVARDIAYGARVLRRAPAFTFVAVFSLALGIGANAAIFHLLDAVRLRPLPVPGAGDLAIVEIKDRGWPSGSYGGDYPDLTNPQWELIRDRQQAFSSISAWTRSSFDLSERGESRFAENGLLVSGAYFQTLGVVPAAGRLFTPQDDVAGCGDPGVVVSHAFWQRQLGASESAVGSRIAVNGSSLPIVGVAARGFHGVDVGRAFDLAVPLCAEPIVHPGSERLRSRRQWFLAAMGRLAPGWSVAQANAHLAALSRPIFTETLPSNRPPEDTKAYAAFQLSARPGLAGFSQVREQYDTPLWLLLALAGIVLVIACANLANLMLARVGTRDREICVRLALGASRGRIVRQLLVESLMLASAGAAAGAWLAPVLAQAVIAMMSSDVRPLFLDLSPGWRVLAFTAGLACSTSVLFGLAPALGGTRVPAEAALRAVGRTHTGGGRAGLRRALVVAQLAMSLVLLVGGLLFARTLYNLSTVDAGFAREGILEADVDMTRLKLSQDAVRAHRAAILETLRAAPAVRSVAIASNVPLVGTWSDPVFHEGRKSDFFINFNRVSTGYFTTLGTTLVAGRDIASADRASAPRVAVVNEEFARRIIGGHPIGKSFQIEEGGRPGTPVEIVGVVRNTVYRSLRDGPQAIAYLSHEQTPFASPFVTYFIRASGPIDAVRVAVKQALEAHDVPLVFHFHEFGDQIADSILRERVMAWLCGFFALLAAGLAVVGVYGVIAYAAQQRRVEIGVRLALGSSRGAVLRLMLAEGGALVASGLALGLAGVWAAARVTRALLAHTGASDPSTALLFDVRASDPLLHATAAAILGAVALAATVLPAWRATRLDPMKALRIE